MRLLIPTLALSLAALRACADNGRTRAFRRSGHRRARPLCRRRRSREAGEAGVGDLA
jgi:hypothetical protein